MSYFFKIILGTSVIVGVLLGLWRWIYDKFCFSLVFVLLILGIVAYSLYFFKNASEEVLRQVFRE